MRIATIFLLFLLAAAMPRAGAGDDFHAVSALWNDFVSALRRGDYRLAHSLFSPESRAAMPFADFVREYGPLSSARELVLAKPDNQSTRVEDDWAEIAYTGVNPGTGRAFRIGVALVKNEAWGLVAARNDTPERLEAAARGLLRTAAQWRGLPDASRKVEELIAANTGKNPVLRAYRIETDGAIFKAVPLTGGLRAFHVDPWGTIKPGETSFSPQPPPDVKTSAGPAGKALTAAKPPLPEFGAGAEPSPPPMVRVMVNGLPELTEPPMSDPFPAVPGDLPEPALPPTRRIPEPEEVALPDTIR